MDIILKETTIKDLVKDYKDNSHNEEGVIGYGGRLDIRPPYQREFVYDDKQREAVIDTVIKGFPLNVMYWSVKDNDSYEIIDGQQRTLSICQYVNGDFSFNSMYFHNLESDEKENILNYKLTIYLCSGTDSERLDWFRTINIAGAKLTDQEIRNAVYYGSWLTDAKKYFSKTGCPAYAIGNKYLKGTPIRQDYLETVIKWISNNKIEEYMATYQHQPSANNLWLYFQKVISWVEANFTHYRREMQGLPWGEYYNKYKEELLNPSELEYRVKTLMEDEDVTSKKGIYEYVLSGEERHLNIRAFENSQKREAYERQNGICAICKNPFNMSEMHGDHITPWRDGGKTVAENCQMLCADCNRRKATF